MRLPKIISNLAILLFLSVSASSCSSYEFRPYKDSVYACFDNVNATKGEVLTDCHKSDSYVNFDKVHEMSPSEKKFMPSPAEM